MTWPTFIPATRQVAYLTTGVYIVWCHYIDYQRQSRRILPLSQ